MNKMMPPVNLLPASVRHAGICVGLCLLLLTACHAAPADNTTGAAFAVTLAPTQGAVALATAVPTTTPTLTLTPSFTPSATVTPSLTVTPSPTLTHTPSITPTLAPVETFYLARPIASSGVDYVDRSYPYASTAQGNWEIHHGVEFQNPRGTPVLAAAPGTVVYAGDDSAALFGPYLGYYGNLVVIQHDFRSPDGLAVFTLYGHLDRVRVEAGQRVETGTSIGTVGATGIALGPHLHFEVRLDSPHDFGATRNPELWLRPYPRHGVLAGRVTDAQGVLQAGVALQVRRAGRSVVYRDVWSYEEGGQVNADTLWRENFVLGDVPEGDYDIVIGDRSGRIRFRQTVSVQPGQLTFVEVVLR